MAWAILSWEREKARVMMLTDSGANHCFVSAWMADRLGLAMSPEVQVAQAGGGELRVRRSRLRLSLTEPHPGQRIGRTHLLDPVLVAEDGVLPFPIQGRRPFLRWYDLDIRERLQEFTLREAR